MSVIVVLVWRDLGGLLVGGSLGLILSSEGEPAGSVSVEKHIRYGYYTKKGLRKKQSVCSTESLLLIVSIHD